jgi:hypothetical protein
MSDKVIVRLINTFEPNGIDWLGDEVSKDNPLTFHHIVKRENYGRKTLDNGALLTKRSHKFLHSVLESQDKETYLAINKEFKELNKTKQPPTSDYYLRIHDILSNTKVEDIESKQKVLIKEKK